VVTPELRARFDFAVHGRIARLELTTVQGGQRAVVELEIAVTRQRDGAVLLQRVYREERDAATPGVAPVVDAAGLALGTIFERFLADAQAEVPR
jgi:ABC-type uncharacterized transport system auxiliary subunit